MYLDTINFGEGHLIGVEVNAAGEERGGESVLRIRGNIKQVQVSTRG
jgi:hypothetical protein